MKLQSIRIITNDIHRLVAFYERVTGLTAGWLAPDQFAEITTPSGTLAFSLLATMQRLQPGANARAAANESVILELRTADVDADFARLADAIGEPAQRPTTMPWGNRSLLFRDPDGNLVNLFTPVTPQAIAKFDRT